MNNLKQNTPWGSWEIVSEDDHFKIKRIIVAPNQRTSYQYHYKREEFWTILSGKATIILNGRVLSIHAGEMIHIPVKAKHRIANLENIPLELIEIQRGSYFGEDDIVRIEDDYNRL